MNVPVLIDLWRVGAMRQAADLLAQRGRTALERLASRGRLAVDRVPHAARAVDWLRDNRRDVAAVGSLLLGTLLIAAAGGLL